MNINNQNSKKLIEFSGTPGSGKDSIIDMICKNDQYQSCCVVTTNRDSPFDYRNSNFELSILWSIFDTHIRVSEVENNPLASQCIIVNRGLFDRLAWARLLGQKNQYFTEIANHIEVWLKNHEFLDRTNTIFLMLTSYEKVRLRKGLVKDFPDRPHWVLNSETIQMLNEVYLHLNKELRDTFPIVLIDDLYQEMTLEEKWFVIDSYLRQLVTS